MATYTVNSDIVLIDGKTVDSYFQGDISDAEIILQKNAARDRAYQEINQRWLKGKTAVPASHISSELKYIEIDLVISSLLGSTFTQNKSNESDWVGYYRRRAESALKSLRIPASADTPSAHSDNTGDGTVTINQISDQFTETEYWELVCISSTYFSVYGSKSGALENIEIGQYYPPLDRVAGSTDYGMGKRLFNERSFRWVEFPFHCTLVQGSTSFVLYDRFTFWTYSSTYRNQPSRNLYRG